MWRGRGSPGLPKLQVDVRPSTAVRRGRGISSALALISVCTPLYTSSRNREFVESLAASGGFFIIVGSLALSRYVPERVVRDLDLLIQPTLETAKKVLAALDSPLIRVPFTAEEMLRPVRLRIPIKIDYNMDILTPGPDIDFETEYLRAESARLGSAVVKVAAPATLRALLRTSDDPKHASDLLALDRYEG